MITPISEGTIPEAPVETPSIGSDNCVRLDMYGPEAIISKAGLSAILGCGEATIDRNTLKGNLPKPVEILGRSWWSVRSINEHIQRREREVNGGGAFKVHS